MERSREDVVCAAAELDPEARKLDMRLTLTEAQVRFQAARDFREDMICAAAELGMSTREIGQAVGLSHSTVSLIVREENQ